jgi:hypothetical protein
MSIIPIINTDTVRRYLCRCVHHISRIDRSTIDPGEIIVEQNFEDKARLIEAALIKAVFIQHIGLNSHLP